MIGLIQASNMSPLELFITFYTPKQWRDARKNVGEKLLLSIFLFVIGVLFCWMLQ